jgi:hypothetical protein
VALLGAAVVVIIGLLGPGGAASAQIDSTCDQVVVDRSGTIADPAALTERARATGEALDAEVRVRVEASVEGGDVDRYEAGLGAACPAWRDGDARADDLLVIVVATADRKTGVYYGRDLADELRNRYLTVQHDTMNPRFQQGDFTGGIDAGLAELGADKGAGSTSGLVTIVIVALLGLVVAGVVIGVIVVANRHGGGEGADQGDDEGDGPGGTPPDQQAARSAASFAAISAATSSSISSTAGGGSTSW